MITAQASFKGEIIEGSVTFIQDDVTSFVETIIDIHGLENGQHGIHVHVGTCIDGMCSGLNGHFSVQPAWSPTNTSGVRHGSRHGGPRHTGDMCNNITSLDGDAYFSYQDKLISLVPGDMSNIVNMFVVIHEDPDDEGKYEQYTDETKHINSQISGNAGARLACAQILRI